MSGAVKLAEANDVVLPPSLMSAADVSRALRELEALDNDLNTQSIRNPGGSVTIPPMSRALSQTAELNQLDLSDSMARIKLVTGLRVTKSKAPTIQITFATEPEPSILAELVTWIRQNLHSQALITLGLQPAIISGCVVRTPDHIYDFSLRGRFQAALPTLVQDIAAVGTK